MERDDQLAMEVLYRLVGIRTDGTRVILCEYLTHRLASLARAEGQLRMRYWKMIIEPMKPLGPPVPPDLS